MSSYLHFPTLLPRHLDVKRDLVYVKRDLVHVKRDLVRALHEGHHPYYLNVRAGLLLHDVSNTLATH
jgi:hypothetical protein